MIESFFFSSFNDMTDVISFSFAKSLTELSALLISLIINEKILIFLFLTRVWYTAISIMTILTIFFTSVDWKNQSWLRSTWVLCFAMRADSMNLFTNFWFMSLFKMIVDVTIKFKFFRFILQISLDSDLWNADWLHAFKTTDFNVQIFNDDINQSFAEFTKIWFLFNQRFSMIILCWSKQVINRNIISFLCSCIMINVYRACVIDFWSEILSYNWINFDFDSNIDWILKRSHSFDIKDSSMKVMSVTLISIRAKDLNIFFRLLKMTSTVNDLKSNESSGMLMKQNMSILLSVTTLTRVDRFSNS